VDSLKHAVQPNPASAKRASWEPPPALKSAHPGCSAAELAVGSLQHRWQLFHAVFQWAVPELLRDLVSVIGQYAGDECSVCEQVYVGRPYQCWTFEHLASADTVALLCHACSLHCAMKLRRWRYDPERECHVIFERLKTPSPSTPTSPPSQ
jgi:hypothetical protein